MRSLWILLGASSALVAACGGEPEPKTPEPVREEAPKPVSTAKPMAITQELGSLDPNAVQRTWNDLRADFDACRKRGTERIEYLGGDVKLFARIGPDGHAKWAFLEDSTIGDRDTEKCIVDAMMRANWPKPIGGDGETRNSFGFDPAGRAATPWPPDKIAEVLGKNDKDLAKCKRGVKGTVHVTLYVEPHNKKEGKVQAVGASVPGKDAADSLDCIVDEVKGWKMPSPGSWAAKVDFKL